VDIPAKQVCVSFDPARIKIEQMQTILAEEDYPASYLR
jgi:hypothetical protein